MRRVTLAGLLLAAAMIALPSVAMAQSKPKSDRNHITKEELAEAPASLDNAYDVVRLMRPQWLRTQMGRTAMANMGAGGGGATELVIYINDVRQQSIDDLKTVKASKVVDMKFLDQNRAVQMRGPGHEMGAIEVTTSDKND
jgi:hypothetical protein